jgi:acyl carrier protein
MNSQPVSNGHGRTGGGADVALLLRTVLAERFRRPVEEITPETRLVADLGVDSLDMIEINIALEERLHLALPQVAMPDEIHVQTVGQLANLVGSLLTQDAAARRADA